MLGQDPDDRGVRLAVDGRFAHVDRQLPVGVGPHQRAFAAARFDFDDDHFALKHSGPLETWPTMPTWRRSPSSIAEKLSHTTPISGDSESVGIGRTICCEFARATARRALTVVTLSIYVGLMI